MKVLGFIATEGDGTTDPCDPYLSPFPDTYSNVSIRSVIFTRILGMNFNAYNTID